MTNVAHQDAPVVNTMHTTVYSHDGYKLNIVLGITDVDDILVCLDRIRAIGLTPNIPGLEPGQEKEVIAAVVRRASKQGTPVIDFYPHWQRGNKFGVNKWAHMYIDTPEQVAEFEALSGLRLEDIPLFEGRTPIEREVDKPTRFETNVKRSFEVMRTPDGLHDNGMAKYIYSYATTAVPQQTPPKQAATAPKNGATTNQRATATEPAQTAFSAPSNASWWTDKGEIAHVKESIGSGLGIAASKMQREFTEFATADDFITAYREYANPVVNQVATPLPAPTHTEDLLTSELLEITHIEPRMATGHTLVKQWVGHARFEDEHGNTHPVQILLFAEDRRQLKALGYDVSGWDDVIGQNYPDGITVTVYKDTVGRKLAMAWNPVTNSLVAIERAR